MFAAKNELFTTPSGYQIQRSLRFRSSASAYLNRTLGTATNSYKWTWSAWVKRGALGVDDCLFSGGTTAGDANTFNIRFSSTDVITMSSDGTNWRITSQVFRDPSAWYHLVLAVDTTQATAANRILFYINGVQVTSFSASANPTQTTTIGVNTASSHYLANRTYPSDLFLDGYMAEVNFIDGQALTPSSFGAINATTGVWSATKYAGTYGTNGFYLNFTDNSAATATTIGKDYSGNGNNWTPNNISVTAGVTYDSMLDAPLGAGGGERGNYTTLNPLSRTTGTVSEANLKFVGASSSKQINGTLAVNSGKWYWEVNILNAPETPRSSSTAYNGFGFSLETIFDSTAGGTTSTHWINLKDNGFYKNFSGTNTDSGSAISSGDVLAIAVDLDLNTFAFYKNNTSIVTGTIGTTAGTSLVPAMYSYNGDFGAMACNFGQRPFSYTPPTGFKALHTGNLGAPVIALPAQNMAATTYTGTNATNAISNAVNSVSFQPDWVWIKARSAADNHALFDSVRGVNKRLISNLTNAEDTLTDTLMSFNTNGFTLGADAGGRVNASGYTYVGWQWKAGGTAVSNTAGSITSSVSANVSAGFSVVTYTGNGSSSATVGHGLGVVPAMVITKGRSAVTEWMVKHQSLPTGQNLLLNQTLAASSSLSFSQGVIANLTSSTTFGFTSGSSGVDNANQSGVTFVAYCFAAVAGYSAFGSYTGNGSADGPFVFTGFRPRFVMIKGSSFVSNWFVIDTSRSSYNVSLDALRPNLTAAETSTGTYSIDILSNGFKLRTNAADPNTSTATFIYAAFAEAPFKNSLAR